jgi:hypothetical protein
MPRKQGVPAVRPERIGEGALIEETRRATKKQPVKGCCCGRYWDRTSDLFRVREARYRCANRPEPEDRSIGIVLVKKRADDEIRTRDIHLGKVVLYQLSYVRNLVHAGWAGGAATSKLPCSGGRYWDRTSDLFRVREARYRCANRPLNPATPETMVFTEVGTGFEPVYTALQAAASPLGQPTV